MPDRKWGSLGLSVPLDMEFPEIKRLHALHFEHRILGLGSSTLEYKHATQRITRALHGCDYLPVLPDCDDLP